MKYILYALVIVVVTVAFANSCLAQKLEYKVTPRADGGYSIDIQYTKRHWLPFSAEGPFPKESGHSIVELIGKGKDWAYRNQDGFVYLKEYIRNMPEDIGYIWIDRKREYIYINCYSISSPDKVVPSLINGKYRISEK